MIRSTPLRGVLSLVGIGLLLALLPGPFAEVEAQEKQPAGTWPGMADISATEFEMGLPVKWFEKAFRLKSKRDCHPFLEGKSEQREIFWPLLLYETPEVEVEVEDYAIGLYEVTNSQYERFLDRACKTSVFTSGKLDSLYAVAKEILKDTHPQVLASIYWLNVEKLDPLLPKVLDLNKAMVEQLLKDLGVKKFEEIKEEKRVEAWGRFTLPEGIGLTVYTRLVPFHWEKGKVSKEQRNTPVRWISALDAEAFCEWAGMHLPTEAEWEYAGRGPKGFVYPWGDEFWDCKKDRNLVVWQGAEGPPHGPASQYGDRPVAVDAIPKAVSPFGLYHVLGNVMEWTSSPPDRYKRSDAKKLDFFGDDYYRVLRSQSWGEGKAFEDRELMIRTTARTLIGPDMGGIPESNRYGGVGFRAAKYPMPARDVLAHRLKAQRRSKLLPKGVVFDPRASYGLEKDDYAPAGQEGEGKVFVRERTSALGVTPLDQIDFATAKAVLEASMEDGGTPVHLGFIYWTGDLAVEALQVIRTEERVEPETPAPGDGSEANPGGENPDAGGEKPAEGPPPPPPPGGEKPANPEGEKPGEPGGEKPGEPGGEAAPGPQPGPKTKTRIRIEEKLTWLAGGGKGYLLSIANGRFALCEPGIAGVRLVAYLPVQPGREDLPLIEKVNGKDLVPYARVTDGGSMAELRLLIATRSKSSKDVFRVDLKLNLRDPMKEGWRGR